MNASVPSNSSDLTIIVAVIGATLGIVNTWRDIYQNAVRLKVIPKRQTLGPISAMGQIYISSTRATLKGDNPLRAGLSIEVRNIGRIPVTIKSLGWLDRTGNALITNFEVLNGAKLPYRLRARTTLTASMDMLSIHEPAFLKAADAYADTECGLTVRGTSPAFQQYKRELRKLTTMKG